MADIIRLTASDIVLAKQTFALMAEVFEEPTTVLSDDYLRSVLSQPHFWAFAVLLNGKPVGGLTAYNLMLTRVAETELFIYDLAICEEHQREGYGRLLVKHVLHEASLMGVSVAFVPADNEDTHALAFYRALGGLPSPVTFFTFDDGQD